jgi:hypothetical protein
MHTITRHRSRTYVSPVWVAIFILVVIICGHASGFRQAGDSDDRNRAFRLYEENKLTEALPILERLLAASPDDIVLLERTGHCLVAYSITVSDPARKREMLARARKLAGHAKELGDKSNLVELLLKTPADGSDPNPTRRTPAGDALLQGDQAWQGAISRKRSKATNGHWSWTPISTKRRSSWAMPITR